MKKLPILLCAGFVLLSGCKDIVIEKEMILNAADKEADGIKKKEIDEARSIILLPQTRAILEQNNSFALDFFKAVSLQCSTTLFLSPYSMSAALSMLYNGASGETKKEIAAVLGMSDYTPEEVNRYYQELTKALLEVDPCTTLSLANAIWANKGIGLKPSFVTLNQNFYEAEVNTLDFSLPSSLKTINDWCSEKTKGTIPKILESIDPKSLVILANAIYFNSFWTHDFDKSKTIEKLFYNKDGSTTLVSMMHQKPMELLYTQMEGYGMVTLPYVNKAFAMNLILPEVGEDIDTLINELDRETWQTMMHHRAEAKVTLSMPRFKIENEWRLAGILAALGMSSAFSGDADFSDMFEGERQASVSDVIQKSYISVDEAGTEAAAVTLVHLVMSPGTPRPTPAEVTMVFNRPFIFAITEQSTGAILFMGKVAKL